MKFVSGQRGGHGSKVTSNHWRSVVCSLAIGGAVMSWTSPAVGETLEDALLAAYDTNPTLLAERAGLRATSEAVSQARAGWQPTLTVNGSYGYQETNNRLPLSPSVTTETDPIQGSVVLDQSIFRGGRTYYGTKRAQALVRAGKANLISVEQQVLLSAVTAYVDVQRDIAVADISRNNVQVLRRQLQASQDRFRVGEITRTDVAQSEARLSRSQSNLIAAEAGLIASRSAFERAVGHRPGDLATRPDLPNLPASEDEALAIALARNPQLLAAREAETASRNGVKQARGVLLPEVSVQGVASHAEDTGITGQRVDSTSVKGNIRIPLYQGGAAISQIRQARQTNNQNRIQISEAERFVIESVANTFEALRSTRSIIKSSQEQVRANEIAFEGVQQEAQVGSRTTLDVLNAEQELLDSRVALVRAQRDEYVAAYRLLAAIGRLTAGDLGLGLGN